MRPAVRLSVVVPCYQAARTLPALLDSLARQTYRGPWEVVLADNGSTDGGRAVAEAYRARPPSVEPLSASTTSHGPRYVWRASESSSAGSVRAAW